MQARGHTKHTCHLSNISMMDNNIQISSLTLELSSEEDMPIYPLMYNIYYDTSVYTTNMENSSYTTTTDAQVN
jgi:hypothetical protein